jgi:hypothetical protein
MFELSEEHRIVQELATEFVGRKVSDRSGQTIADVLVALS